MRLEAHSATLVSRIPAREPARWSGLEGLVTHAGELAASMLGLSAPTLPLGARHHPMRAGADLSLRGTARLVAETLERLDLNDVTLVGIDTGGAVVHLLTSEDPARIARAVLVSCDAFDKLPSRMRPVSAEHAGLVAPRRIGHRACSRAEPPAGNSMLSRRFRSSRWERASQIALEGRRD